LAIPRIRRFRRELASEFTARDLNDLPVFNGGGSGSVCSTSADELVNEVTIGSGILCPALFSDYSSLDIDSAIAYATPVVRKPSENIVTCYAGGYVASGAVSENKQPLLFWPSSWKVTRNEGVGEVQTPLIKSAQNAQELNLGDLVFFRPAKSGEVMERFSEIQCGKLSTNPPEVDSQSFKTYRGHGVCFA
jgi:hypothetical protein